MRPIANRGAVHTEKSNWIERVLEIRHRLSHEECFRAEMQSRVVANGFDALDFIRVEEEMPPIHLDDDLLGFARLYGGQE